MQTYEEVYNEWIKHAYWLDETANLEIFHLKMLCQTLDELAADGKVNGAVYSDFTKTMRSLNGRRKDSGGSVNQKDDDDRYM